MKIFNKPITSSKPKKLQKEENKTTNFTALPKIAQGIGLTIIDFIMQKIITICIPSPTSRISFLTVGGSCLFPGQAGPPVVKAVSSSGITSVIVQDHLPKKNSRKLTKQESKQQMVNKLPKSYCKKLTNKRLNVQKKRKIMI